MQRINPIASTLAILLLVVACSNTPAPAASGAPTPSDVAAASAPPIPSSPAASPTPSVAPTTAPTPKPTPKPTTWSKATTVPGLDDCLGVVAVIDSTGGDHLAAECSNGNLTEVRYASSSDGRTWTASRQAAPAHRYEMGPQLAVDGGTLYVAYSRLAPTDGGCGDDGLGDVGVYVRSRQLPHGSWSDPRQVGATADELQSFRVTDGVVHATVTNDRDGKTYYESLAVGSTTANRRIAISGAAGSTALRVGDDGKPRVAFEASAGLVYGTIDGGGLSTDAIPGTKRGWNPVLVLEPGNVADVVWTRSWHGGCAEPDPLPEDGTYFSTNAGGTWHSTKLSSVAGGQSITVDPATGEIHLLVSDFRSATLFERSATGSWSHRSLASGGVSSTVIRQDPTNGSLFVAYVSSPGAVGGDESINVVKVMTKG